MIRSMAVARFLLALTLIGATSVAALESPRPRLLAPAFGSRLGPPSQGTSEEIAREFLARQLAVSGELAHVATSDGQGGVRFVTFEQRFGVPVAGSRTTVAVARDGSIVAARLGALAPARPPAIEWPQAALKDAVAALGLTGADGTPLRADDSAGARMLLPQALGSEPVLRVRARPVGDPSAAEDLYLSARDLRLMRRESAHFDAIATVRAWPQDPASPSVLVPLPDPALRPSVHAPLGWAEGLETSGNNVRVVLDRGNLRDPDGPRAVATGDPASLDFAFTGSPADDADAALANVFWALNDAHDRFRALGFDEPSGAMQEDDFGRGGIGGDRMLAFVQSGSIDGRTPTNAIRLTVAADGSRPEMTVGLFEVAATNEIRDGAFERDLLQHEYAHGVLVRLLGDAACFNGHHPRGLSEGWADFFAASFTRDPVIGAWTRDDPERGHRSSSLDDNFYSLANFCLDGCNPNRNGEIWAGLLWDVRRMLIARLGEEPGILAAERLALEAVRYLPCSPTFLDARDALLLAEEAMFGGELHCAIWDLLLLRGMGADAGTTGTGDTLPQAGYRLPPQCTGSASLELDALQYGLEGDVAVIVLDGAPPSSPSVRMSSSGGDEETIALDVARPWLRGGVSLAPGAPAPGDGVLQVAEGDTITASYEARGLIATAGVSGDAAAFPVLHLVLGSACQADDDHLSAPGYFFLPGFLDAGEAADIVIAAFTTSPGPLVDATVEVESLNPNVSIAPTAPIPLGTVAAAPAGGTTLMVFTISASASPSVVAGETAELVLRFRARGRSSEGRMQLVLSQDYVLETGLSPFAGGVETFEADSPTAALWTHRANVAGPDAWRLEGCAGDASAMGYANASPGCASYPDGQGAPSLVSPVLVPPLPADAVAWRISELSWRHQSELYIDPTRIGCERDVVAAFLTTDPDSLPTDGLAVAGGGTDALRVMTSANDTVGFADSAPAASVTGAVYLQPGQPTGGQRLAWVFYSDATDPATPGCVERVNDGRFFLDNVRFRYEQVRQVPEATPCAGECKVLLRVATVPDGPSCPGDAFVIDASASEIAGCLGPPTFSFTGPGVPPEYASTPLSSAPAIHDDAGGWRVAVTCETGPSCSESAALTRPGARSTGRGGPLPGTVRVRKLGSDVEVAWQAITDPPRHGVWRAGTRAELAQPLDAWALAGRADAEGLFGDVVAVLPGAAAEPGLACYRVAPRDPCTDLPR